MLDEPIDVLDSYIRFVDVDKAADSISAYGIADVPPEIEARGRLAANLWRCGWLLESDDLAGEVFRLSYTDEPGAPTDATYHGIFFPAYFIAEGSFVLLRGGSTTQYLRFRKRRVDFERGHLAFVPAGRTGRLRGHIAVGLKDRGLRSVDADFLTHGVRQAVEACGMQSFEIRTELSGRGGRHVRAAGDGNRPR